MNDSDDLSYLLSKLTFKSIQDSVDFVKGADLKTVQIDQLKAALDEVIRAFGCFAKSISNGLPLFRAMRHHATEEFFESLNRIYPNPIFLTKLGRANREHTAIFYLSGDPIIALHEISAKAGDTISLLECRPRNGASPVLVPIGIDQLMRKHGVKAGGGFPETNIRIQELLNHDPENLRKYAVIDDFLTNEFLKSVLDGQEYQYKTTVAIAELFLTYSTEHQPIDGLAYPSVAGLWTHANIALWPEAFHRLYRPIACQRIRVTGRLPNLGVSLDPTFGIMASQINSDGRIKWPNTYDRAGVCMPAGSGTN